MSSWWDETAQPAVAEALSGAVAAGHVSHAFVMVGPAGVGQRDLAAALGAALNCELVADGAPCGKCPVCDRFRRGTHSNLVTFAPEGAFHLVSSVREQWIPTAMRTLTEGHRRVIRIVAADRMNESAQNAFLKALEEPGPSTVWLLEAEDDQALLDTILSRCRRLDLRLWGPDALRRRAEELNVPQGRVEALVRAAVGSPDRLASMASRECPECQRVLGVGDDGLVPRFCLHHKDVRCTACGATFKGPPKRRRGKAPCDCDVAAFDLANLEGVATEPEHARTTHLDVIDRLAMEGPGAATAIVEGVTRWASKMAGALDDDFEARQQQLLDDHGVDDPDKLPRGLMTREKDQHKRRQRDLKQAAYTRFLDEFGSYVRDIVHVQAGGDTAGVVNLDRVTELTRDVGRLPLAGALRALADINRCRQALGEFNGQPQLQLERILHPVAAAVFAAGRAA